MEKIFELSFTLHDLLLETVEYKNLKMIEKKMREDKTASSLIAIYQDLNVQYGTNKTQELLKKLHQAKLKMDQNELVIEYKKAYKQYQILVGKVSDIAFKDVFEPSTFERIIRS